MTSHQVHPSSFVDPGARLGHDVRIGPFCVVGAEVELADGVELVSHVSVVGRTRIGARTKVYPFASMGQPPQDLKYRGEPSRLEIGADTVIRENVTLNPGTEGGGMLTSVGDGCLLMVGAHVAHDCRIGDRVILVNNAILGGHVTIGEHAIVGGNAAVHQFVRIGAHAMIGGMTGIEQDVIPYGLAMGERGYLAGLNLVGLKRRGFDRSTVHALRALYKTLFIDTDGTFEDRLRACAVNAEDIAAVKEVLGFLTAGTDRKILQAAGPRDG